MSVPENSRTKSKLEVCVKAHDLCCYTLQITANKKIFTEEYQRSLTDRIVETAIGIHCDCWNANNIYVRDAEDYQERKRLQEEAAGGKLTGADIDYIDKITHAMKSIKTTIAMEEANNDGESGYYPYMGGYRSYENIRGGGRSNQRRDSRGRYSRENRGGYSRDDARENMVMELRELMRDAPDEHTRMRFRRFIDEIENA